MTLSSTGLAALEVAGRLVVRRVPGLRRRIGRWARRSARRRTSLSLTAIEEAVLGLANPEGRHLLVHSSWDGLGALESKPSEVLAVLRRLVGAEGTLIMPTHPASEDSKDEVVFDVDRTPSAVGLLTETLRRSAGAVRSPFPIAPAAALGKNAGEYGLDFRVESSGTPYGCGSPWWKVAMSDGLVLFLGIDFARANTLQHVAFDLLGPDNPIPDFYVERGVTVVQKGRREEWAVRRPRPQLEDFVATIAFRRMMLSAGLVHRAALPGVEITVMEAKSFLEWHLQVARETGLPYWRPAWAVRRLVGV